MNNHFLLQLLKCCLQSQSLIIYFIRLFLSYKLLATCQNISKTTCSTTRTVHPSTRTVTLENKCLQGIHNPKEKSNLSPIKSALLFQSTYVSLHEHACKREKLLWHPKENFYMDPHRLVFKALKLGRGGEACNLIVTHQRGLNHTISSNCKLQK